MPTDDQPLLGTWFLRVDRFGDTHAVAAQNKGQSCALASIKMVVFKINKMRPGHAAFSLETKIEEIYKAEAGEASHDFDQKGSNPGVMAAVLNRLDIGNWAEDWCGSNNLSTVLTDSLGEEKFGLGPLNSLIRKSPAILGCLWGDGTVNMGGHAVVADSVTSVPLLGKYATICDPWDAQIHFTKLTDGQPVHYTPSPAVGIDFWGTTKAKLDTEVINMKVTQKRYEGNGIFQVIIRRV